MIDNGKSKSCSSEYYSVENLSPNSYELDALLLDTPCTNSDERGFYIKDRISQGVAFYAYVYYA